MKNRVLQKTIFYFSVLESWKWFWGLRSFDTFAKKTKLVLQVFYVKLRMILSKCGQFSAVVFIFVFSQKNI